MNPAEEIPPEVAHRAYYRQPVWKRVVVIAAGPAVNIALAFLILWVLLVGQRRARGAPRGRDGRDGLAGRRGVLQPGDRDRRRRRHARRTSTTLAQADLLPQVRRRRRSHGCTGGDARHDRRALRGGERDAAADAGLRRRRRKRHVRSASRPATRPVPAGPVDAAGVGDRRRCGTVTAKTVETIARHLPGREAQGDLRRGRLLRGDAPDDRARRRARALPARRSSRCRSAIINLFPFLPLDGGHIFWALAEKVRGRRDPVQRDGARRVHRLRARDRAVHDRPHERHRTAHRRTASDGQVVSGSWRSRPLAPTRRAPSAPRRSPRRSGSRSSDHPDRVAVRTKDDEVSLTWSELRDRVDALAGGLRGARRAARRHRRADARQPARVPRRRPRGDDARRDAVLDLPDLLARADRLRGRRRRRAGGDRSRRRSPTRARGARGAARARARDRAWRATREGRPLDDVEGADPDFDVEPHWRAVEPEDLLTLIYTSGTTGPPKGVQLVAPQPDGGRRRARRRRDRLPRRRAGDLVAADARTSPSGRRTTTSRSSTR